MSQLGDLLKYENEEDIPYEEFVSVLDQTDAEQEKDGNLVKKAFQVTKSVTVKLYEEYKVTIDIYKEEAEKGVKKGLAPRFHFESVSIFSFH
jgi:hypothetical protein